MRHALVRAHHHAIRHHHLCLEHPSDEYEQAPVFDALGEPRHQPLVIDLVEEILEVDVHHPFVSFVQNPLAFAIAVWQLRPGRNPWLFGWNVGSYIGSSTLRTASCTTRSTTLGMPSPRSPPPAFGIHTRRMSPGSYVLPRANLTEASAVARRDARAPRRCSAGPDRVLPRFDATFWNASRQSLRYLLHRRRGGDPLVLALRLRRRMRHSGVRSPAAPPSALEACRPQALRLFRRAVQAVPSLR